MAENKDQIAVDPNDIAAMIFEYWFRTIMTDNSISTKDITHIIIVYYNITNILKWSRIYKSKNGTSFEFSDDDKCVKKVNESIYISTFPSYKWILPDIEPVKEGMHCWRINVNNTKPESKGGWIIYEYVHQILI